MTIKKIIQLVSIVMLPLFLVVTSDIFGQQLSQDFLKHFNYRSIGPTRQGGRIVDFAVPVQESYTFYVATATGGLWKTINNGQSYKPVFDNENVISIGDIAVAPSDPNIVWIGTGESNNSSTDPGISYWGDGVYKSTDGGMTWTNMGLKDSFHIGRIIIHPQNPNIVYVAAPGHFYTDNQERGLYKTIDGGITWTKTLEVKIDNKYVGVVDVVMNPKDPNTLFAASWDRERTPWSYRQSGRGSGIYKTTDGGKSWLKLTRGLPADAIGRIGLTISPKNPEILYAILSDGTHPRGRIGNTNISKVFRTDNGGTIWRQVSPEDEIIGGGSYYGQIRVDPNDENHLYFLSGSARESIDGGKSWFLAFEFKDDHHALWIDPENSNHLLSGNDHGFGITYDSGKNWYHPDDLPLAQLYAVGVDMDYPYNVYGGTQDNGSWKGPSTKKGTSPIRFEDWEHVGGGDGFYNLVDPTDSRWLYNESQWGSIQRRDQKTGRSKGIRYNGGELAAYIAKDRSLRFNWNSPILISPHNSNVIYHGANILLRSDFRGENWKEISPDLTTNDPIKIGEFENAHYCTITTIDESPVMKGVIWVGTDDGNVQLTKDNGKTWTKLNDRITGNPGYFVSRVTASHHDTGTAYVTYTGRRRDDSRPFVYKTNDFGKTWTSIANNLPNEAINVIKEDRKNRNLLFLGTDKAVYVTIDGGRTWAKMKNNMPTQPVHDLVIHPRENDLVVGSHGRGIFITDVSPLQELTQRVLEQDIHLFDIEPKVQWVITSRNVVSSQNFAGPNEPYGIVVNYYLKNRVTSEVKITVYKGTRAINEIMGTNNSGLNCVEWNMSKRRERTESEIILWQLDQDERDFYVDEEESFHSYDSVDYHRISNNDPKFINVPVQPGEYAITLTVDGRVLKRNTVILQDHWYDK